jgi:DNA-binding PadR family transcriptional regulator
MNVRLLVLGLLAERPMHGYELRKLAEDNRIEAWAGVLPGSIYHALRQLAKERLIARTARERIGGRVRERYGITPAGRAALADLVREAWHERMRSFPTSLYGALSFRSALAPAEERASLDAAIGDLEREIAAWEVARPLKGPMSPSRQALFDNGVGHLRLDLELLVKLRSLARRQSR